MIKHITILVVFNKSKNLLLSIILTFPLTIQSLKRGLILLNISFLIFFPRNLKNNCEKSKVFFFTKPWEKR